MCALIQSWSDDTWVLHNLTNLYALQTRELATLPFILEMQVYLLPLVHLVVKCSCNVFRNSHKLYP